MCHVDVTGVHLISIPAPPRGATFCTTVNVTLSLFQFTPLREGRRAGNGNRLLPPEISIHAPPRGATVQPALALHLRPYFNSRPSARGDADVFRSFLAAPHFNSRPSARGDSSRRGTAARQSYFNSRPSARGDTPIPDVLQFHIISIPAPPRGATEMVVW